MKYIINSPAIIDNRQRYKNDILTYLTMVFNIDIAIHIYKYYDNIYKDNLKFHIEKYEIMKPISHTNSYWIILKPYEKNIIFETEKEYDKYVLTINLKKIIMKIIKMIGHPDFISYTKLDLKSKGCISLSHFTSICEIFTEEYIKTIDILINIEKEKLNVFDKIKVIDGIIYGYIHDYPRVCVKTSILRLCEIMFQHYLTYIDLNLLKVPGYMIDKHNIIYGA